MAELVVEHAVLRCRGEEDLIVLVRVGGYVVPVQHGIAVRGFVEEAAGNLDVALVREESETYRPAHAVPVLKLSNPNGLAAVPVVHEPVVYRILAGGAVMVEDVPLHAAADPGSEHAHIGGLDGGLAIEDLVAVGLVRGIEEASADVREHAHFQIIIFQEKSPVGAVHAGIGGIVVHRVGIHPAFRPLVCEIPGEQGGFFGGVHPVCGEVDGAFPNLYRSVLCIHRNGEQKARCSKK